MYRITASANRNSEHSSLPVYFFSCLTANEDLRLSSILNRGESGQPCLVSDFTGNALIFFPIWYNGGHSLWKHKRTQIVKTIWSKTNNSEGKMMLILSYAINHIKQSTGTNTE